MSTPLQTHEQVEHEANAHFARAAVEFRSASPGDSVLPHAGKGLRNEVAERTFTDIWEAHAERKRLGPGYHVTAHINGYCIRKDTP